VDGRPQHLLKTNDRRPEQANDDWFFSNLLWVLTILLKWYINMVNCQGHHVCGRWSAWPEWWHIAFQEHECLNQRVKLILVYKSWFNILRYEKKVRKQRVQTKVGGEEFEMFQSRPRKWICTCVVWWLFLFFKIIFYIIILKRFKKTNFKKKNLKITKHDFNCKNK